MSGRCCAIRAMVERSVGRTGQFRAPAGCERGHIGRGTGCAAVQCISGGSPSSAGRLQSMSAWHQRCWNCCADMVGCRPRSQWLRTPALSLMSAPIRSQSCRICSLVAVRILAAMCAGEVRWPGRERAEQYDVQSWAMTRSLSLCQRLTRSAEGCHGPRLSSASRRSAWSGGARC